VRAPKRECGPLECPRAATARDGVRRTIMYGVGTPPNERTNASTRGSIDPSKPNAVP
jgi:hypothetical protein